MLPGAEEARRNSRCPLPLPFRVKERHAEPDGVEDVHARIFAHPDFAYRWQPRFELRELLSDGLRDRPLCGQTETVAYFGAAERPARNALLRSEIADRIDEFSDPAPRREPAPL